MVTIYDYVYDDRKQEVFAGLVVEDGDLGANVYMLKIDDIEALRKVVNDTWDNPLYEDLTEMQRIDAIHKAQKIIFDQSNGKIEKSFLEQFSSAGISLYKADATMSKFDKLTLNNEEVKPNPCN